MPRGRRAKGPKRETTTVYFDPWQLRGLQALGERTRVPWAVYVRDGVTAVLAQHGIVAPVIAPGDVATPDDA